MVRYKQAVIFSGVLLVFLLVGCSSISVSAGLPETAPATTQPAIAMAVTPTVSATPLPPVEETQTPSPTFTRTPVPNTPTVTSTSTQTPTATPDTRLKPEQWRSWPIVPTLSARGLAIYQEGQKLGNDPHVFSRIGDCQSESAIMMGIYDNPRQYKLNPGYEHLQITIDQFKGSFSKTNITVRRGFGIASVFNPLLSDREKCNSDETPLACEFRLSKPVVAIISMGTNWCAGCTKKYEEYLRKIVDYSIQQGVIPIISTKADNIEKDWSINEAMARVAYDYDIPLWNFWAAVQYLPDHGLMPDKVYLTVPGWNERGFTGLQALDAIWIAIQAVEKSN